MVRPVGSVLVSAPARTPQKLPYARVLTVYFEGRHPPRQGSHAGKFHALAPCYRHRHSRPGKNAAPLSPRRWLTLAQL